MQLTHVLITRPLEASLQLAEMLQDPLAGQQLQAIVMPLYRFTALEPSQKMQAAWSGSTGRKLAIFTSPRAVQYGLTWIGSEQLRRLEFAAIGPATRAQLESAGHANHLQAATGFTSEDLLQIPALAKAPGEAVIFCAPGGRQTLAEGLKALGWGVIRAMVYERVALQPATAPVEQLLAAPSLLSLWTSVSALELAQKNLPQVAWEKILQAPALAISARIQHHLQQCHGRQVLLADGPGNRELLSSIERFSTQKSSLENGLSKDGKNTSE